MIKRDTVGTRLKAARKHSGMSAKELVRRIREDFGRDVGESTVRDTESDRTPNFGIKTVEAIAQGLGLDAMEVISLALDNPPESEPGFKASRLAFLWKRRSKLDKQQQAFIDGCVEMLIEKTVRWRK